ncbi:hypothetical protein FE783_12900 [Paenibacillus mesophilus]|uniref:recombinase family protein n=1 Tax=Paenibacillus mesophilus TaxID=2582849 RepID=UPI00110DC1B5|nr:recombinase family protein [Paenibacillus mesophilus]TMV49406.1 hypothetical protein FE783_12900 [Paenibacillus mesophilus]
MRVAIYTRVSSDRQAEEGFSLEAQYEQLIEHIKIRKWELVRVFTDPGISAKDLKRPGVQEMIADLKNRKFDAVLVHKLDRLTRNIGNLHDLIDMFNNLNVKLISLSENIDISTAAGKVFVHFLGLLAQYYRENLGEEVLKGLRKSAMSGNRINLKPVFGYDVVDHKLIVNKDQAEIVKLIFDLYVNKGKGHNYIAKYLNSHNYISNFGRWYDVTVAYILRNLTYIGKNHYTPQGIQEKLIVRDGDHDPIIAQDLFDLAQAKSKKVSEGMISSSSYEYPYSTILKCGVCGSSFSARVKKSKYNDVEQIYRNYRCYGKDKRHVCTVPDISERKVEKLLFENLQIEVDNDIPIEDVVAAEAKNLEKERARLEKELSKSAKRRENWQYAFGDGKLPYSDYVKLIDTEMQRAQDLQVELDRLPVRIEQKPSKHQVLEQIKELKESWEFIPVSNRKNIIQTMFSGIELTYNDGAWAITAIE